MKFTSFGLRFSMSLTGFDPGSMKTRHGREAFDTSYMAAIPGVDDTLRTSSRKERTKMGLMTNQRSN